MLHCDILIDQTLCQKHLCINCLKQRREQPCECGVKYQEHYLKDNKIKPALKHALIDDATKYFNRENKIRKNELYQSLDYDLVNLLAYLNLNPTSHRISSVSVEEKIKHFLRSKKKEEEALNNEKSKRKKAVYISRTNAHHE